MRQNGDKLDSIDVRIRERQNNALHSSGKNWQVFGSSSATFAGSICTIIDMSYIWCPEEPYYVARLWTVVDLLQDCTGTFDQLKVFTVLDQLYNA